MKTSRTLASTAYLLSASLVLQGCTTTNYAVEKTTQADFCNGRRAKEKYVFILAANHSVPPGTSIDQVGAMVTSSKETSEFIRDHFIQAVLAYFYKADSTYVQNEIYFQTFRSYFRSGYGPSLPSLIWIKDNRFVSCENARCDGMKFPGSSDSVSFENQGYNDGRCEDFLLPDGYVNGLGCRGGNPYGLLSYLKSSGFNAGAFVSQVYLSPTQSGKKELCAEAGLKEDCFEIFRDKEKYYDFTRHVASTGEARAKFPMFRGAGNFPDNDTARMRAESMLAHDLALLAGTKISTKVNHDWTVYRITWDPTPFCEFGRPSSDFVTH